jgi:hypothetical protein
MNLAGTRPASSGLEDCATTATSFERRATIGFVMEAHDTFGAAAAGTDRMMSMADETRWTALPGDGTAASAGEAGVEFETVASPEQMAEVAAPTLVGATFFADDAGVVAVVAGAATPLAARRMNGNEVVLAEPQNHVAPVALWSTQTALGRKEVPNREWHCYSQWWSARDGIRPCRSMAPVVDERTQSWE